MPQKTLFRSLITPLLTSSLWISLFFIPITFPGMLSVTQSMEWPSQREDPSEAKKPSTITPSEEQVPRYGFAGLLQVHMKADKLSEDLEMIDISSKSKKRDAKKESESSKKKRSTEKLDDYVTDLVTKVLPQEHLRAVLNFLELPKLISSLIDASDVCHDPMLFWKPIIETQAPQLRSYISLGKKEEDIPADLRPMLTRIMEEHLMPYQKWQSRENLRDFLPDFLNILRQASEGNILPRALTLARHWYVSEEHVARRILIFLGYPNFIGNEIQETGINKLKPETADLILDIIEHLEKLKAWPKDISPSQFLRAVAEIPLASLRFTRDLYLDKMVLSHEQNNYGYLFISFWQSIASLNKVEKPDTLHPFLQEASKKETFSGSWGEIRERAYEIVFSTIAA